MHCTCFLLIYDLHQVEEYAASILNQIHGKIAVVGVAGATLKNSMRIIGRRAKTD